MPISEARLAANRANSLRSSGPSSEFGKSISRKNSYKHGLTGAGVVLSNEDAEALDGRCERLLTDFKAVTRPTTSSSDAPPSTRFAWTGGHARRPASSPQGSSAPRPR